MTMKMASTVRVVDEPRELQVWKSLASEWWGKVRPDVTIHVLDTSTMHCEAGISRFSGQHMSTLAVSKMPWAAGAVDGITLRQLRRIGFEVMEWLMDD